MTAVLKLAELACNNLEEPASNVPFLKGTFESLKNAINSSTNDRDIVKIAKAQIYYITEANKHGQVKTIGSPLLSLIYKDQYLSMLKEFIQDAEKILSAEANDHNINKISIGKLPVEILAHTFGFLRHTPTYNKLPLVSKSFCATIKGP